MIPPHVYRAVAESGALARGKNKNGTPWVPPRKIRRRQQQRAPIGEDDIADLLKDDRILRPKEAARALNLADATLQSWRSQGIGPPYISINGKCAGYRIGALRAWVRACERGGAE